jgi:hypothetical protein
MKTLKENVKKERQRERKMKNDERKKKVDRQTNRQRVVLTSTRPKYFVKSKWK